MEPERRHVMVSAGTADASATRDQPSTIMYKLGGRMYPWKTHALCKVCQSMEYRQEIENALLKSYSYATIQRSLPADAGISVDSIRNHVHAGHLPLDEAMRRVVIEESARERGISIEDHAGALADHITFAKLGVQRVMERMQAGELEPDIQDGIAMAGLLLRLQEQAGEGVDNEVMIQAFMVYWESVKAMMTPEQIAELGRRISANPVMAALVQRTRQGAIPVSSNGHEPEG